MKTPEEWAKEMFANLNGAPTAGEVRESIVSAVRDVQAEARADAAREYAGIIHDVSQETGANAKAFAAGAKLARGQVLKCLNDSLDFHRGEVETVRRHTEEEGSHWHSTGIAESLVDLCEKMVAKVESLGPAVPLPAPEVTARVRQVLAWAEEKRKSVELEGGPRIAFRMALIEIAWKIREALGDTDNG